MVILLKSVTEDRSNDILVDRFPYRIGRSSEAERPLPMIFVSRFHCRFTEKDGEVFLEDLQSANGTFVNRKRIGAPTPLHHGDEVNLGPMPFRVIADGIKVVEGGRVVVVNAAGNEISTVMMPCPEAPDPNATLAPAAFQRSARGSKV